MSKTVTSNSITFIDNTDNRKIEVFIASNLPTTQIYNTNTGAYSPDWSSTPLTLTPTVYLDSTNITSSATIQWKRKYGANAAENISTNQTLSRSTNELSHSSGIVTYICVATYQNMTAQAQVTFVRADTGTNGAQGADGTSVTILDTAYTNTTVTVGNYYDLYSDSAATIPISTTGLNDGDSYLVSGYLCVYNTTQQKFLCVGKIQGPQGEPGENAKLITLSSNSQIFKVNKLGTISPSTISVTGTAVNTSISSWRYSTDGGLTYNTSATGVSRSGNVVTITGANITSNSITIKASDGINADIFTVYKVADGTDGTDGAQGTPAPIAFLTNEHISFVANSNGQVAGQTVTTNIVAYNGTTKVTPVLGTISGLPTGMTINTANITTVANELIIPITIANNATFGSNSSNNGTITIPITSPVSTNLKLNWSKVNAGADGSAGVGISAIAEHYAVSTSNTTAPTTWQDNPPVMTVTNKYLWNYETITYTNNTTHDTEKRVIGVYGNTGNAGSSVSISSTSVTYQAGSSGTSQPTGTWTTTIPTVDNGKYLWTKTAVAYSNGTSTEAYSVSYKGTNGSDGTSVTISSTAVTYQASTSGTNVPTGVWNASIPSVANGQFLWTRTIVTYSNNTSTTSYSVSYSGINGNDAYTVILSNESHTFAGTNSAAITSSTKCEVFAYKGSTRVAATIGTISGLPTGMTAPITSNGTTSAYFSPTVTTSMTTTSGVLTIPITADGKSFTKTFSYALSLKGDTGSKGDTGTSASLVDITPSALYFKSTTGKDGTFNPEYIYLYPRFQTVTYSNWQYSINGGSTWVNASGANGLTIGTYNSVANSLRISRSSTLYTDAVTSISFRCNSSNGSVYDTVSIAKIYDVVDIQIGGRNLLLNSVKLDDNGSRKAIGRNGGIVVPNYYNNFSSIKCDKVFQGIRFIADDFSDDMKLGDSFTFSATIKNDSDSNFTSYIYFIGNVNNSRIDPIGNIVLPTISKGEIKRVSGTFIINQETLDTIKNGSLEISIQTVLGSFPLTDGKAIYMWSPKLEKGNKPTDWTPASDDVDLAITAAQTSANTANTAISDMANDNILTPTEKTELKREYAIIISEKPNIDAQANVYSNITTVTTAKNNYNTAYNNIVNNVNPVLNATGNSSINGTTFRGYFSNYYSTKEALLTAILNASKGYVDNVQVGGRNLIPSKKLYNGTWDTKDFTASAWALTVINETELRKILEPSTTYTMSCFVQLIQRTTVPTPYSYQVGFLFYSSSTSSANRDIRTQNLKELNQSKQLTETFTTPDQIPSDYRLLIYTNRYTTNGGDPIGLDTVRFTNLKLEKGNKPTDYTPAPEDIDDKINTASGIVAMLSNEAHFFVANASGVPTATSTILDVIGYKGSTQQNTTVGTITGLPSAGMTATISNNGTQNTKITVAVTTALTSAVADSGTLTIPITIDGKTINKIFSWSKSKDGSAAKLINLSASGQIFKVASNGTVTPSTLTVSAEVQNTTASAWTYSVNGAAFSSTVPTGVSRSGNTVTITGSTMTANSISIRASDGTNSDVVTVSKVSDGNGISSITNYYLATASASGVTTSTAGWTTSVQTTTESKKYLWNYEVINYTNGTNFTSSTRIIGTYGSKGTNAIAFQLYAPNGYVLSDELPTITLQTFAYDGSTAITSGATYKWYKWIDNAWGEMYGSTSASISIARQDVFVSQTYKCEMTYKGVVYSATETVEDRGDAYESVLCTANSDIIGANARFIIAYVLTYNQNGEVDALLGPISRVAPSDATSGSYWYAIDESAETVTLKKYDGTTWSNSTDSQSFTYDWNIGGIGKVKVIKKSDISIATNVQCDVILNELGIVTRCNQLFYDTSDPVVSSSEPSVKFDGQIWIKTYENGTFSMYTWSANDNKWIVSESDSRQKIFTKKPGNYQIGDLWLVGTDYIPSGFTSGVLLKAKDANITYADSNWVDETVYAQQISQLKESVDKYNQYFNFTTENGLQIRAKDSNNNPSRFYTQLTNSELGFYQDNDKVAYINNHKMNITEADINIVNTPLLKIGNFSFIVESNGSMSIVTNN